MNNFPIALASFSLVDQEITCSWTVVGKEASEKRSISVKQNELKKEGNSGRNLLGLCGSACNRH